jgi:hypothetical protein
VQNSSINDTVGCDKQPHCPLPDKMLRAYKHSTHEHRALLNAACERLTEAGLALYPTNCPDLRAKHPQNDIVFVILGFQEVSGTRIEIRIDSCPRTVISQDMIPPWRVRKYDPTSKALWAVYRVGSLNDLEAPMTVIGLVCGTRPNWGNRQATAEPRTSKDCSSNGQRSFRPS